MTPIREILGFLSRADRGLIAGATILGGVLALPILGPARAAGLGGLAGLCLAVALIDGRRFLVPDLLVLPIAALGLLDAALSGVEVAARLLAMAALGLALLLLRWAMGRAMGRTALGLGDVKLLAAAAAWLPADLLPVYVGLAAGSGLIESLLRRPRGGRIAFGRHLAPWLWLLALSGSGIGAH